MASSSIRKVEIIRGTQREYQNVSTFAQSVEQKDRFTVFSAWLEMVKSAERDYKNTNGRYGNLATLRKADLHHNLVFESDSSAAPKGKSQDNFVPKDTRFEVTVSADGQHFGAVIGDERASVSTGEHGPRTRPVVGPRPPFVIRDFQDSPEGLIFAR